MRRKKYALGFKDEAVKQVIDRGHPVVDVAKPLGISESVLYTWVSKFEKADAPLAADHPADARLQVILKCPHSHRRHRNHALSVFKWFETDGLISQRRDWLIGFKV